MMLNLLQTPLLKGNKTKHQCGDPENRITLCKINSINKGKLIGIYIIDRFVVNFQKKRQMNTNFEAPMSDS